MMIHAESFSYEAKVKTPIAVEISEDEMSGVFGESLIVMYSTEKEDEEDPVEVSKLAAREIGNYLSKIGPKPIVLFPFAFLVSREEKSSSQTAARMENLLMEALGRSDLAVVPFGWYKKFTITSMGHKYTVHSARVILPGKD
jgi:threonyl-tRNA synthetase